ncbi:MAG: hypothetical protein HQL09_03380 [Nitrospirae bacterium]|nr:hypothetical protein [Nitrospirota bacterium]
MRGLRMRNRGIAPVFVTVFTAFFLIFGRPASWVPEMSETFGAQKGVPEPSQTFRAQKADLSQKQRIATPCRQCHKPDDNILLGLFDGISNRGNIIRMRTGNTVWLVRYGNDTKLIGAEKWSRIPKEKEISIATAQKDDELYAVSVTLKPSVKLSPDKIAFVDDVTRLVAAGPEKGNPQLVDSRSAALYNEGHIPGAISIPGHDFNKFTGILPKEKDRLLIFYCTGPAGRTSLLSAARAEKSGYTKVKIFTDGLSGWKKAGKLVVSSVQYYMDCLEKGIPVVLVDLRPIDEARRGHIIGAVSIPGKDIPNSKDRLPSDKSAPIILYDNDTKGAADDFINVRGWGYSNVSVLEGGFEEWRRTGGLVINGDVTTKIVYLPKLRPGEISVEEFKRMAEAPAPDKLILDVRDEEEAMQGMLRGALNVPAEDIKGRLMDIPKNKEVIAYSAAGIRAEMAYRILKEAGYKVRFLNANVRIDRDGKFTISKE